MKTKAHIILIAALLPFLGMAQGPSVSLNPTIRPSCHGLSDGGASVTVTGGYAPYHYHWSCTEADTPAVTGLAAGHYSLTVTNSDGSAPATFSFNLTEPAIFNATLTTTGAVTCQGIHTYISATGGTTPYTNTGTFTSPPGNNVYIVSDANGCADTLPISVPVSHIQINVSVDSACNGGTVQAQVSAWGGIAPYTGTGTITAGSGVHYFRVSDSIGCMVVDTVIIPTFTPPVVEVTSSTSIICSSDSVTVSATPGYGSYQWNTGNSTASSINAKLAGNYYVVVTDQHNCRVESNHLAVNVHPATPVSISQSGDTLKSFNAVSYQWYYDQEAIVGAQSQMYVARKVGDYAVGVVDTNGCHAVSNYISVTEVATGIDQLSEEVFQLYPNPSASTDLHLTVNSDMVGSKLEVYDNNGRVVFASQITTINTDIQLNIEKGIYFLRISTPENKIITRKLLRI